MSWGTLLYAAGFLLALCAALLLLIGIVSWIGRNRRPEWFGRLFGNDLEELALAIFSLFGFSLITLFFGLVVDQPPSSWSVIRNAAEIVVLVDLGVFVVVVSAAVFLSAVALALGIYTIIRERRIPRYLFLFIVYFMSSAVVITVIVALIGPIALRSAAAIEWLLVLVSAWVATLDLWINTGMLLLSWLVLFVVLTIGVPAFLILAIALIQTLFLGRPTERSLARWLQAPWNDDDEREREAPPGRSDSSLQQILRPDRIAAAFGGAITGGGNERPIFRGARRRAQEMARQRRQFLQAQLNQYRDALPTSEIVEVPPTLVGSYEPRRLSEASANARLVALMYQENDEPLLLFGRVLDAIRCFVRSSGSAYGSGSLALGAEILLRNLRWWERWPGEYPWVVLVRTNHSVEFVRFLEPLRSWLGIGVRTARPAGWRPQRGCVHSNELGTVAGYLRASGAKYALTCAHVIPSQCTQYRVTREPRIDAAQPDAALLRQHPCTNDLNEGVRVRFISNRRLRRLWQEKTPVHRAGGYSTQVLGYVKNREAAYIADDGMEEEFPACVVMTRRIRYVYGLLPSPILRRRFSTPGDSGSWVTVENSATDAPGWLGMIAAGGEDDNKMESYVLKASALLLYFRRHRQLRPERPLVPYITEDF